MNSILACICSLAGVMAVALAADAPAGRRTYEHKLTPIQHPRPILADYPEFMAPIDEKARFEAPALIDEAGADLEVRAWRFLYNARGIIEIPNRLRADRTAVIVVHPWGVDDEWGWKTPDPAGIAFFCTPEKNRIGQQHAGRVINPFLKALRSRAAFIMYSEPGREDPIRRRLYRSVRSGPSSETERAQAAADLKKKLAAFRYEGKPLPERMELSSESPVADYFRQLPATPADPPYNPAGFWDLPIPVSSAIDVDPTDVVIYDAESYAIIRDFLKKHGVRHILLAGYCTELCYKSTTAGYDNLSQDFNVFLVGDATLATFAASDSPRHATNAAIAFAARDHLITQVSWIHPVNGSASQPAR